MFRYAKSKSDKTRKQAFRKQRRSARLRRRPTLESLEGRALMAAAVFDWSMPARFGFDNNGAMIDTNNNGLIDLLNRGGNDERFTVNLKQTGVSGNVANSIRFDWRIEGENLAAPMLLNGPSPAAQLPQGMYYVTLTVNDGQEITTTSQAVQVRDFLIVSMGDSFAAGQGNPEQALTDEQKRLGFKVQAQWGDAGDQNLDGFLDGNQTHRSSKSYAALAAMDLENLSNKFSVTFLSVAASGAKVGAIDPNGSDDERSGGMLDRQTRMEQGQGEFEPQVDQVDRLITIGRTFEGDIIKRKIDALFISAGVNDVGFATMATQMVEGKPLDEIAAMFQRNVDLLPGKYDMLAEQLDARLQPSRIFITEYPDPIRVDSPDVPHDADGIPEAMLHDILPPGLNHFFKIDQTEARWGANVAMRELNNAVHDAAERHGWTVASGVEQAFRGRGYSSPNRLVRTATDSREIQGPYTDPTAANITAATIGSLVGGTLGSVLAGLSTHAAIETWDKIEQTGTLHPTEEGHRIVRDKLMLQLDALGGVHSLRDAFRVIESGRTVNVEPYDASRVRDLVVRIAPANPAFIEIVAGGEILGAWQDSDIDLITILPGATRVDVQSLISGIDVRIENADIVAVGHEGSVQQVLGNVHVTHESQSAQLVVDNSADAENRTALINHEAVRGLAPGIISFDAAGVKTLEVHSGRGRDTLHIPRIGSNQDVQVFGGAGGDTFHIGLAASIPFARSGQGPGQHASGARLVVDGQRGNDQFNVETLLAADIRIGSTTFTTASFGTVLPGGTGVGDSGSGSGGGGGSNPIPLPGPALPSVPVVPPTVEPPSYGLVDLHIRGGHDNDVIHLSPTTRFLDQLPGKIVVEGGDDGFHDTMHVYDNDNPFNGESYTVTTETVRRPFFTGLTHSGLENVHLNTGNLRDTIQVTGTLEGTDVYLATNGDSDTVFLNDGANTLDSFQGRVFVDGGDGTADRVVLQDTRSPSAVVAGKYTVDAGTLSGVERNRVRRNGQEIVRAATESLEIQAGAGHDIVEVLSTVSGTEVTLSMGAGNDRIFIGRTQTNALGDLSNVRGNIVVSDTAGTKDSVTVSDQKTSANTSYTLASDSLLRAGSAGAFSIRHSGIESVDINAGQGHDTFRMKSFHPNVAVFLNGGGGQDTLDYSSQGAGVNVNLSANSATGLAKVSDVENVTGTRFADLLVGDSRDNILSGLDGHDVLIGGRGSDVLLGGNGHDLLIGGHTAYDTHRAALDAIFQTWASQTGDNTSYRATVKRLRDGVGAGAAYRLADSTVFDDGQADKVLGEKGLDYFWAHLDDSIDLEADEYLR